MIRLSWEVGTDRHIYIYIYSGPDTWRHLFGMILISYKCSYASTSSPTSNGSSTKSTSCTFPVPPHPSHPPFLPLS